MACFSVAVRISSALFRRKLWIIITGIAIISPTSVVINASDIPAARILGSPVP